MVHAHALTAHFKEDIIQAFYDGIKHKPETTFGSWAAKGYREKEVMSQKGVVTLGQK